jgi:hypothetical protein
MSSVVENQSRLSGEVLARSRHPGVERWDQLRIRVDAVEPVEGRAHLLGETAGQELTVVADRSELPAGELAGWRFDGPVRLAGPEVVEVLPEGAGAGRASLVPPGPTPTL